MELSDILNRIDRSDDVELNEIVKAVMRRYQACFPEWEVIFLSLPRADTQEKKRQTEELIAFVRRFI